MKQETLRKLEAKANTKTKDGVYSYEGHPYAVIKGKLKFVGDFNKIYEITCGFCVIIWQSPDRWKTKAKIKELFNTNRGKLI
jgi:hypothetical protein